ncbi:hypothetical protein [Ruminococcus albus]|uniref:CAAX protease self-immunity n=1 Tax=Ruminococcus albus (strain ATCC 27210 / DSM 20455 / JCM 14654 / NCDO 2250 / 7) TaxID=697329 RepID=E6UGG1_RUMA7|nr:hypothetical protein [Ruminococcus albus]ADU23084.1 hypothetical protein Rumal_2609 [Ruminococcus albus 7 = DSM 20455]
METTIKKPDRARKRQLIADLIIIGLVSFVVLLFAGKINAYSYDPSIPLMKRLCVTALCGQFAIAGLGITIVCIIRREKFTKFGLNTKNLLPALLLSLACCVPDFIYQLARGHVHPWFPFYDMSMTPQLLEESLPVKVSGLLITALFWGFFEGFNYVVIRDKISELSPSKYRFWDVGAFVCAVMCILVHGVVGVTSDAFLEMVCTLILIYGMLIVRKETGNAWGCVLIFFVYWNAL